LVSKISVIRIKLILKELLNYLLTGTIDFAKVTNHTATAGLDSSEVKACMAALTFIFTNGAKYNVDPDTLTNELQQLGLPKEHCDALVRTFSESKQALRSKLQAQVLKLDKMDSIDWRVDYILATTALVSVNTPSVQLCLNVRRNSADIPSLQQHVFEVDSEKFKALITELQSAYAVMGAMQPLEEKVV